VLFITLCYVIVHVSSSYVVVVVAVTNVSPLPSLPLSSPRPMEKRRQTTTTMTTTRGEPRLPAAACGDDGRGASPDAPPHRAYLTLTAAGCLLRARHPYASPLSSPLSSSCQKAPPKVSSAQPPRNCTHTPPLPRRHRRRLPLRRRCRCHPPAPPAQ